MGASEVNAENIYRIKQSSRDRPKESANNDLLDVHPVLGRCEGGRGVFFFSR